MLRVRPDLGVYWMPAFAGMTSTVWKGSSRRLRQRVLGPGEGPVEPAGERLDVVRLDGRAAPDAQAGRRVAIMGEIVAGAFLLDHGGEAFGETRLRVGGKLGHRRIDDLETDRGVGARRRIAGEEIHPGRAPDPVGDHL